MAGTFDDASPGQETVRYGDYIYVPAGGELYAGEAVTINGDGEAVATTGAQTEESVAGVAYINAVEGEEVTIKTNGTVVAKLHADAGKGDTVGSHDGTDAGTDGTAVGSGELANTGDEYVVLDAGDKADPREGDGTTAHYGEVSKR